MTIKIWNDEYTTQAEISNCYIDFPYDGINLPYLPYPTYTTYPVATIYYVCDGCGKGTHYPVYCYARGKFGYYCSTNCAHGNKEVKITCQEYKFE